MKVKLISSLFLFLILSTTVNGQYTETGNEKKQQQIIDEQKEYERRLTLKSIDGIYIPEKICECFTELDKLLSDDDKKEIKELPKKSDMITYHLSLGMTIRNMWGLWSGSRLQKYFIDQEIYHPDDMSGYILDGYYYWLKGNKGVCDDNRKDKEIKAIIKSLRGINESDTFNPGRLIWKFKTGYEVLSKPAISDGVVYFGSYDGHLYAVDTKTGLEKWDFETDHGPISTSSAVSGGMVYIGGHDSYLYALDKKTGREKWRFETDGVLESPVISDGVVFLGGYGKYFYAVDAREGREKWKFKTRSRVGRSIPVVSDGIVYFGDEGGYLYAVDIETGVEKWRFETGSKVFSPAVLNGVIYFSSTVGVSNSCLFAVDTETGQQKWKFAAGSWIDSTPAVLDGVVYFGSLDSYLYALDSKTGREKWKFETDDWIDSSPAISGAVIYIGSHDGFLYAVDIKTGKVNWSFYIGEKVSTPAVADGVIYVGSRDGYLYALLEDVKP